MPFLAGLTTGFLTTIPPGGPVVVLVLSEATRRNTKAALSIGFGATLPMGVWSALGWFGADHLVPPSWISAGQLIGALALIAVGSVLLVSGPSPAVAPGSVGRCLALGAVGVGSNPVMLVNFAAIASGWLAMGCAPGGAVGASAFGFGVAAGAAAWFCVAVLGLSRIQLSESGMLTARRALGAVALCGGGGGLVWVAAG